MGRGADGIVAMAEWVACLLSCCWRRLPSQSCSCDWLSVCSKLALQADVQTVCMPRDVVEPSA